MTLGLGRAGITTVVASDCWPVATQTFRENFSDVPLVEADARELTGAELLHASRLRNPPTLVTGGPPCQGFSSAGMRRARDERNSLVGEFARLAVELAPEAVLFENVEGFLTLGGGAYVRALLDPLVEAGFVVGVWKLNVAAYGVPQLRKRVVAIAVRGRTPTAPAATHRPHGAPGADRGIDPSLPQTPGVWTAVADLPTPGQLRPGDAENHFATRLSALERRRIRALRPGETMRDLPRELQHASYVRRARRRVSDGVPAARRGGAPAGIRRLIGEAPSKAITASAVRELIHPNVDRFVTLRECARIQSFPDSFIFCGSQTDRAALIGNAVPPLFAEALGRSVVATVALTPTDPSGGRVLTFLPGSTSGASPALLRVLEMVRRRYKVLPAGIPG